MAQKQRGQKNAEHITRHLTEPAHQRYPTLYQNGQHHILQIRGHQQDFGGERAMIITKELNSYSSLVKRMGTDKRVLATHVSLFTALFIFWQRDGFVSPFAITRKTVMAFSKIASIATYHKCIRELDEYGYIRYQPSFHPAKGSLIYWPDGLKATGF